MLKVRHPLHPLLKGGSRTDKGVKNILVAAYINAHSLQEKCGMLKSCVTKITMEVMT